MDRSFHFIPGDKPELFEKINVINSDYFILDLEDAVQPSGKQFARNEIEKFLFNNSYDNIFIRVNSFNSGYFNEDLKLLKSLRLEKNIVLPKINNMSDIEKFDQIYKSNKIIALIETFQGLNIFKDDRLIKSANIFALGLGIEDMLSGLSYNNENLKGLVSTIKSEFSLNCKKSDIISIDGIPQDIFNAEFVKKECQSALSMGFTGKFSVHPSHVVIINDIFKISEKSINWAIKIKELTDFENKGYIKIDGEIITPPKVKKAKLILDMMKGESHDE